MVKTIANDTLEVKIDSHGAEVKSVTINGKEYMWNGDPKYWGRTSPVLFPFVGAVRNGTYSHEGTEYKMGQHGFARDMEFTVANANEDTASFILRDTEETYRVYPFHFELGINYHLEGDSLLVEWKVRNTGDSVENPMYFSIGAHPAFNCPVDKDGTLKGCFLKFKGDKALTIRKFGNDLVQDGSYEIRPDSDGFFPLDGHTFDNGALVLEEAQVDSLSLTGPDRKEFVTLKFHTPVLGIWSPVKKNAPFVCIEPWYGRADAFDFDGELKDREYGQSIKAGEVFEGGYSILFS